MQHCKSQFTPNIPIAYKYFTRKYNLFLETIQCSENGTFIFNQSISKIVHPHDLELDDSLGASVKKEFVRFYEVQDKSNLIKKSSSLKPKKSSNGRIIGGTFNIRQGSQWTVKQADQMKIYALIRKRSEYKKCKENG